MNTSPAPQPAQPLAASAEIAAAALPLHPLLRAVPDTLATDRLLLRCPRAGDGEILHHAIGESLVELRRFLASLPWVAAEQTIESSEIYCRNAHASFLARKDLPFLIFERASSTLVGCVGLHRPVWETPKFEVGYWCRTSMAGRGYVTEAVREVVRLAAEQLSAARIELVTDAANEKSRAVAQRAGFRLEGVLRSERRAPDGSLRDTCIYAVTPDDL